MFCFSVRLLSEIFPYYKKNTVRCYHKCTYVFMQSASYSCHILLNLEVLGKF